ncbi:MAG TPA: SMI1/KNR4 family protein [Ardenticatenaceae bacterium]|nr:SMI1/KNR4 family protein [Ardenticatenaceae bacterium]
MYDWLDDIWQLAGSTADPEAFALAPAGATNPELAEVEQPLGISLPPSYAVFLRRWNGATLQGSRILSTGELLDFARRWGFRPYQGEVALAGPSGQHAYAAMPAHFLVFRTSDLGSDVDCFDTRPVAGGEYPVCHYDPETDDEDNLKPRFPSFEALLLYEILGLLGDPVIFEDWSDEAGDEAAEQLFAAVAEWEQRLQATLEERGADLSEPIRPNWSAWH